MEKLRKKLQRKYAAVFKNDLGKEDRVNLDRVKIELIDSSREMGNVMIPAETHRHLQDAAAEELARLLKSLVRPSSYIRTHQIYILQIYHSFQITSHVPLKI